MTQPIFADDRIESLRV